MGYQESAEEKQKRQAKEAGWKAEASAKEKKADYEAVGSRGDAARKGMEEGRMDTMGTAYKKGGKIMEHKHKMEHDKKHAAGHMHEQDKVKGHSAGHKMHHEHVKAMCMGGSSKAK